MMDNTKRYCEISSAMPFPLDIGLSLCMIGGVHMSGSSGPQWCSESKLPWFLQTNRIDSRSRRLPHDPPNSPTGQFGYLLRSYQVMLPFTSVQRLTNCAQVCGRPCSPLNATRFKLRVRLSPMIIVHYRLAHSRLNAEDRLRFRPGGVALPHARHCLAPPPSISRHRAHYSGYDIKSSRHIFDHNLHPLVAKDTQVPQRIAADRRVRRERVRG